MIRVLHVVGAMNIGGTETMLMEIYKNIDTKKVQFDFISYSSKEAYYDKEIESLGGKVIRLKSTYSIKEHIKAIKENGPYDVVHSHTLFHCGIASLSAKLCGVKTIISHAHTTSDLNKGIIRNIYKYVMKKMINSCSTQLMACSEVAGEYLFGEKMIKSSKYRYFANIIDYEKFINVEDDKVEQFKLENNLKDKIVIGHIGRFTEAKNHKFLLKIMKDVIETNKDIRLLLVGDGKLKNEIIKLSKELNIEDKVIFTGFRKDINTMLYSMDLFVFPSIFEGLGLVILEAQASGLNCIVSQAIQKEADLEIGLVHKLNLDDDKKLWINKILSLSNKNKVDKNVIIKSFNEKKYTIQDSIKTLYDVYGVK